MIQTAYLHYRSSRIHYAYGQSGAVLCICFHGYGESLGSFQFLEQHLPPQYQLVAVDLPFHGATEWHEHTPLREEDLVAIVNQLRLALHCPPGPMVLMGFSMGGRLCLSLLQAMPQHVSRVVLLAPDGLVVNTWYKIATQTHTGNRLFKFTMRHPAWFRGLLRTARMLGIVNKSIYKFTRYYIKDREACRQLYERWTCLSALIPDMSQITDNMKQYDIPLHIVYGEHDRIITRRQAGNAEKQAPHHCMVHVIPGGHQLLQEKNAVLIVQCLTS